MFGALRQSLYLFLFLMVFLRSGETAQAATIASQTTGYSSILNVWQLIQELGDNLNGTAGSFTFRVSTSSPNSDQFDSTAGNSQIIDKTDSSTFIKPCLPPGSLQPPQSGLSFNTIGVPSGYEDVTFDFSCRNFQFIPGHRYLILISNANMCSGCIKFTFVAYGPGSQTDFFPGGGLRFSNGNPYDWLHHSGSCAPYLYI